MGVPVFSGWLVFGGRRNRKSFALFFVLYFSIDILLSIPILDDMLVNRTNGNLNFLSWAVWGPPDGTAWGIEYWIYYVFVAPLEIIYLIVSAQRIRDFGFSGWYSLLQVPLWFLSGYFVAVILLVTWIVLVAVPGTIGDNRYGEDPLALLHALFGPKSAGPAIGEQSGSEAAEFGFGSRTQTTVGSTAAASGRGETRNPARIAITDLERLDGLRKSGALTAEEFERLKKKVLDANA